MQFRKTILLDKTRVNDRQGQSRDTYTEISSTQIWFNVL